MKIVLKYYKFWNCFQIKNKTFCSPAHFPLEIRLARLLPGIVELQKFCLGRLVEVAEHLVERVDERGWVLSWVLLVRDQRLLRPDDL